MTLEADLVELLEADAAIVAIVRDDAANEVRIYPVERPEKQKNVPAIVYTVIFGAPATDLDHGDLSAEQGDKNLENVRLQLDVWAKSHDDARELGELVQARLGAGNASIRFVRISRQSDIDPVTREHREILDFSVWHSP